jgi:hypothetical protein
MRPALAEAVFLAMIAHRFDVNDKSPHRRRRWGRAVAAVTLLFALAAGTGCYVQRPLPRDPSYRPASWEPVMGVVLLDGEEVMFDEPAVLETGRVVGRVDGSRYVAETPEVRRLLVGRKTLDKPRTVAFGAALVTVFTVFFISIGIN